MSNATADFHPKQWVTVFENIRTHKEREKTLGNKRARAPHYAYNTKLHSKWNCVVESMSNNNGNVRSNKRKTTIPSELNRCHFLYSVLLLLATIYTPLCYTCFRRTLL